MAEIKSSDPPDARPFPEGTEDWTPEQKAKPRVEPSPDGTKPERKIDPEVLKPPSKRRKAHRPYEMIDHNRAVAEGKNPTVELKIIPRRD